MQLETDKAQKEADIRIRSSETQVLEKEYAAIQATLEQLEKQKGEAQKRLDELDDRVRYSCQYCVKITLSIFQV